MKACFKRLNLTNGELSLPRQHKANAGSIAIIVMGSLRAQLWLRLPDHTHANSRKFGKDSKRGLIMCSFVCVVIGVNPAQ
jgi:hypothetical protein